MKGRTRPPSAPYRGHRAQKLAKDRLPDLRRANAGARLADAQLAVAREHGFTSWRALRARLDRA
ncbi:MAG TPA: hypothetical protein VFR53_11290, partial [Methylomirabilota bacterium]|nr:hypothetical protein [Methylomirabilota bacterium]